LKSYVVYQVLHLPHFFADRWIHFEKRKNHDLDLNLFSGDPMSIGFYESKGAQNSWEHWDALKEASKGSNANLLLWIRI
jgi:hypothetical protein